MRDTGAVWFLKPDHNYIYDHYVCEEDSRLIVYVDFYQFGTQLDIYTNIPIVQNKVNKCDFHRQTYKKLNVSYVDDSHAEYHIHLRKPGSFHFYALKKDSHPLGDESVEHILKNRGPFRNCVNELKNVHCTGMIVVEPLIKALNGTTTSVDVLRMQTSITKCLGNLADWESRLLVAANTDYNAIHLTPVQELGSSNSNYSISDHFKLDNRYGGGLVRERLPPIIASLHKHFRCIITDVVLNHVSSDSPFLVENPDIAYNLENSPHLKPAWLVDRAIRHFTKDIVEGKFRKDYLTVDLFKKKQGIDHALHILRTRILPDLHIEDYFLVNVSAALEGVRKILGSTKSTHGNGAPKGVATGSYSESGVQEFFLPAKWITRNNGVELDYHKVITKYLPNYFNNGSLTSGEIDKALEKLQLDLTLANSQIANEMQTHTLDKIVDNIKGGAYYRFLDSSNSAKQLSTKYPIVDHYFSDVSTVMDTIGNIDQDMELLDWYDGEVIGKKPPSKLNGKHIVAHQGWTYGGSTLNFALPTSRVYLMRELVVWGDSVKLNYGNSPKDSPKLWTHMTKYVVETAKLFDGFRLDNCHSTPLHVLETLIDEARKIKPNLIVVAELFTNSEELDNYFVNRIGITCLVRERMVANNPKEFCRLVHRFGGKPVASFYDDSQTIMKPSLVKAIFTDLTHDNPCPYTKFSPFDYLPTLGFVSISTCAIGSVRGFDELVPYHINVVDEERKYGKWAVDVSLDCAILEARLILNQYHDQLHMEGYSQLYVDQLSDTIITVTRTNPNNWNSIVLVINCAFERVPDNLQAKFENGVVHFVDTRTLYPVVTIPGVVKKLCVESTLARIVDAHDQKESDEVIQPDRLHSLYMVRNTSPELSKMFSYDQHTEKSCVHSRLYLNRFSPGSLLMVEVGLSEESHKNVLLVNEFISHLKMALTHVRQRATQHNPALSHNMLALLTIVKHLSPSAFNVVLFRTDEEERADGNNLGVYDIPSYGKLCYCGLIGLYPLLKDIRTHNNLGHPLCDNLRQGTWMLDYIVNRLQVHNETKPLSHWLSNCMSLLKELPYYLLPAYFERTITTITKILKSELIGRVEKVISVNHKFVKDMVVYSYATYGHEKSSFLPLHLKSEVTSYENVCTLAAGLPFFAHSWMRSWGRDNMISIRGLFLVTGRFKEAEALILSHAACVRHGLVPNLLADGGKNCRYNCRDASWWFLLAIKDYCTFSNDLTILNEKVRLLYQSDDSEYDENNTSTVTLGDIMHTILNRHFEGISFTERNAGPQLDSVMVEKGFDVECGVDFETGFIYGGNAHNCGTWMDKMGSSTNAGNYGVPATPRDGSAVELVGICYAVVKWLDHLKTTKKYKHASVKNLKNKLEWTWKQWSTRIKQSFENCFWIPENVNEANAKFPHDVDTIHQLGIYKDSYRSSRKYSDYQLRPNFLIALAVAPDLFADHHVAIALNNAIDQLAAPIGIKTLCTSDWEYRGFYNNADDTHDYATSKGFSYHQGPEWVWPVAFFLRSLIDFVRKNGTKCAEYQKFTTQIRNYLNQWFENEQSNNWGGLPELTNQDGSFCWFSCNIQSWSVAAALDVLHAINSANFQLY